MPFTEDLAAYLGTDEHATEATFNSSTTVNGIFEDASTPALGVAGTGPQFLCAAADVASPVGKSLEIGSTTYTIVEQEPDGTGMTLLKLELA